MDYLKKRTPYQLFSAAARILVMSGLVSAVTTASAFAQTQSPQPAEEQIVGPSLRELIDTVPVRETVPADPLPTSSVLDSEGPTSPIGSDAAPSESNEEVVRLTLRLGERRVYVYRGESVVADYPVAIGRVGWETPTGEFEVFQQVVDPGWTNPLTGEKMSPGPDNPLGDRWIAFWTDGTNFIGFHGTPNRESVGRAASHGCIRMYNEDVRQLYEIVSVGTPVTVVE